MGEKGYNFNMNIDSDVDVEAGEYVELHLSYCSTTAVDTRLQCSMAYTRSPNVLSELSSEQSRSPLFSISAVCTEMPPSGWRKGYIFEEDSPDRTEAKGVNQLDSTRDIFS